MNLNFDDTLYKKMNAELDQKFNCTVPFLPAIASKKTGLATEICKDPKIGLKAIERYNHFRSRGLSNMNELPCAGMDIYLGLPFITNNGDENEAYIKIYLKPSIKVKNTVLNYDFVTVVAEVGGYIGLLLGISVVDITIKINSLLVRVVRKRFPGTQKGA